VGGAVGVEIKGEIVGGRTKYLHTSRTATSHSHAGASEAPGEGEREKAWEEIIGA